MDGFGRPLRARRRVPARVGVGSPDLTRRPSRRFRSQRLRRDDRQDDLQPLGHRLRRHGPAPAHERQRRLPLAALVAGRRASALRGERRKHASAVRPLPRHRPANGAHARRAPAELRRLVAGRKVDRVPDVPPRQGAVGGGNAGKARGSRLGSAHQVHRSDVLSRRRRGLCRARSHSPLRAPRGRRNAPPADERRLGRRLTPLDARWGGAPLRLEPTRRAGVRPRGFGDLEGRRR